MQTKIQKWGNSLALRIPPSVANDCKLQEGKIVRMELTHGKIIVDPATERRYSLEELLAGIKRKNIHQGFDTGEPVGREAW